jgi:Histidine kinase-, DNA gyrase B-, and HSP90-like ATPase
MEIEINDAENLNPGDWTNEGVSEEGEKFNPNWSSDAPRGGRAVLTRILKESATVPLFFAQTLVQSLRDVGYNNTTSALCEHVDNAIEAGASEIRIYFRQIGRRGAQDTDILVYDNGRGMPPNVLKVATSFGGSMSYGNRKGIGRFGMGMKTAALSVSPVMELYSWQEKAAFYNMTLDTTAVGRDRSNLVELPDPTFNSVLPESILEMFTRGMNFPKDQTEQRLLAPQGTDLYEQIGPHGTIVFMPDCDRLTYATDRKLVEHCVKEMARVYRRQIAQGLRIYVNNRVTEAVDPTYSMPNARHTSAEGITVKTSRLIVAKTVKIPTGELGTEVAPVNIKLYALPIEDWSSLTRKAQNSSLHLFDGQVVSILRNDREVHAGYLPGVIERHSENNWLRIEIDFSGELDEAFGVASNKQGVRPKSYVTEEIERAIGPDVTTVREEIRRVQAKRATDRANARPSASEQRATEADIFQTEQLNVKLTMEEQQQMEANLRGLAVMLKREGESDEDAYQHVLTSKFLISYRDDPYWPFYHIEHKFGRVILTINRAHPFFTHLYKPLLDLEVKEAVEGESPAEQTVPSSKGPVLALELLLLSMARSQSVLSRDNPDAAKTFDAFRRSWSEVYRVQLTN